MTMKRKSASEIFQIHKRAKANERGEIPPSEVPGSPGPPHSPDEAESSNARIRREAVEEFKKSPEFRDLMDTAGAQSFVEGFYACRRWVNYHSPQLELTHYNFSTIPPRWRYPPHDYLERAEAALIALEEEERLAAEEVDEDDEEAEEAEPEEVIEKLPSDGEEAEENLSSGSEED